MPFAPRRRALVMALAALALGSCNASAEKRTAEQRPPDVRTAPRRTTDDALLPQRGKATVTTRGGRVLRLDVEIASNDETRARGLMFRRSMPEMAGMIFVFAERRQNSFWMKNTLIPLDMLFIDSDGTIAGIVEMAEPLTTTPRQVRGLSNRVLEVNGGWCGRHGVRAGDKVDLEGMFDLR